MDILHLVDRLEELFNESRAFPFTRSVIVDEDRMLDLIDQMRVAIPEEVKKAQQVLAQRDRILAQAQEESSRTLTLAREKSEALVEKDALVEAAKVRAREIKMQAEFEAEQTRRDADEYVIQTLSGLVAQLEKSLKEAKNGIVALQQISPPSESEPSSESTSKGGEMERAASAEA